MIDLHTHTTYSDGTWSVKKLLTEAEKSNIELLSITDHNSVKAYYEIQENDYSELFSNRIINGVELNVIANGSSIELLVYDYDLDAMNEWCLNKYKKPDEKELFREYNELYDSSIKNGIVLSERHYNFNGLFPIDVIYHDIKSHPENESKYPSDAWNNYGSFIRYFAYDPDFPTYVNLLGLFPSIEETVKMIRNTKGKIFIAHIYKYPNRHNELLEYLVSNKLIDGIEVYHSYFIKEQMDYLYNYCKMKGLLISGGSDCHGEKKLTRRIGVGYNNLNIDRSVVNDWI